MKSFCLIDFETASACDLKKAGAWRYAEDATTEILCLGYTTSSHFESVLTPERLSYLPHADEGRDTAFLREMVNNPEVIFIAHNVAFEKAIWRNIMVKEYGWPDIPNERWHDTQAVCAMKGLPLKLERAASALGLKLQKDKEGSRVTIAMSKYNRKGYLDRSPEKLARVYEYNRSDLGAELELYRRVRGLGSGERSVWLLDQAINERGIRLDRELIGKAQRVVDQATVPLTEEFIKLTGIHPNRLEEFKKWLVEKGCPFPKDDEGKLDTSLGKEAVAKMLGDADEEDFSLAGELEDFQQEDPQGKLAFEFERPLRIRQLLGSASIKKLAAMRACICSDGRARGLVQYHGAGPGRWAGRLFQPHNFPRPTLKEVIGWKADGSEIYAGHDPEALVDAIRTGDAEYVEMMFGNPIEAVANCLRHIIIPDDDKEFMCGDYNTIECRIVLALAGQWDKVASLARGEKPYVPMAEAIYHRKIDKEVDLAEYTIGKNTVLGCGFQMGWKKFKMRYCPKESDEFAQGVIKTYREQECPEVPKLWRGLERASCDTVWTGRAHEAYGITYALEDGWLTARLPSGRKLWYFDPKPVRKAMPWDKTDVRPAWQYSAWKAGRWKRVDAYGGIEAENAVQALARDCLVAGMFRVNAAGYPTVLSVHDEDLSELTKGRGDLKEFSQLLCEREQWAVAMQIPLAADCWKGPRYKK